MHDVIVVGAGPAGMSAGLYAAAHKLKTLVIAKEIPEAEPEDFGLLQPGDIIKQFKKAVKSDSECLEFLDNTEAVALEKNVVSFSVETGSGKIYYSRAVIIATGRQGVELENIVLKDAFGKIKTNARMQTNVQGVFAAGDAANSGNKPALAAAGEGAKAAGEARDFLKSGG